MEVDELDILQSQKQPSLGPLIALLEKLYRLVLLTAPKAEKHRG